MPLTITKSDMLRSKCLDPGWYKIELKRGWEEPSKSGDSTNHWWEGIVSSGPAQKDGSSCVDVPAKKCFSEKAPGFAVPFFNALGANIGQEGKTLSIEKIAGKSLLAYNEPKMYEGKLQNDWVDFKAVA